MVKSHLVDKLRGRIYLHLEPYYSLTYANKLRDAPLVTPCPI